MAPIWIDNNILVDIYEKKLPFGKSELLQLQKQGHELLIPKGVEHEFLDGIRNPVQRAERAAMLESMNIKVDMMANKVPLEQVRQWRNLGLDLPLKPGDSNMVAQVKAGAQARGITNPKLITRDAGDLAKMRRLGVDALEFKPNAIKPVVPVAPPSAPPSAPPAEAPPESSNGAKPARFFKGGMKQAFKEGLKDAFKAEAIAAEIPLVVLHFADKFAKRDALRNIQIKFIKEGFAKGVAAGIMGWTYSESHSNLKYRVTPFRVQGMEDPGGELTRSQILQVAESWENYAVDVGFGYSEPKSNKWKETMRSKGFSVLTKYGYHLPSDPSFLFTFDFIKELAYALRPTTDPIIGPAIHFD